MTWADWWGAIYASGILVLLAAMPGLAAIVGAAVWTGLKRGRDTRWLQVAYVYFFTLGGAFVAWTILSFTALFLMEIAVNFR